MGGGSAPVAPAPVKKTAAANVEQAETASLIRRRGLASTKKTPNSFGGGFNLGGGA